MRERLAFVLGLGDRPAAGESDQAAVPANQPPVAPEIPVAPDVLDELPLASRFGRAQLGVVSALLIVGLLVAGVMVLHARPVAIASPPPMPTASPVGTGSGTTNTQAAPQPTTTTLPAVVVVHVLGAVRRPGLVELPEHSRVQDVIDAAGGLTRDADAGELNLAQPVADGEQVVIGTRRKPAGEVRGAEPGGGASSGGGGKAGSGALLDLNRATQPQLEELPGVGPVTAQNILDWRAEHDRFSRVEELQEIDGIGPKTFARIAPHVRV